MRNRDAITYLNYSLELHSCVVDIKKFENDLHTFLLHYLNPDFDDDISISLDESVGLKETK